MSLAEIGRYIEEAGFSPDTHCVLGWVTSADACVFRRALLGSHLIFDTTSTYALLDLRSSNGGRCLQTFNLASMLRICSDLESVALGYAHRSLIGNTDYDWHNPEVDCLGMSEILRWFISNTAGWIE